MRAAGHSTSEGFWEIIGTFSQVITIQREPGSKLRRPCRLPADKTAHLNVP